ncbi:phage major capsid protein, P2 family [Pseudoalteromonas ruthenica]|uniref:phage major capsid protein, P2 family n=1 Tax=Pseudoalteromonas ruthenica TaxID=151081 RepID=UPI00110AE6B1|nr:phage major capsid protein, P2 family [Pseudoalteromonas ruthenica]TMO97554.1 phage major capsid protein, P2 family [Pseudoalteromonas ruthenica]
MKQGTRLLYSKVMVGMAAAFAVNSMAQTFSVSPSVEQTLQDQITAQSNFLGMVSTVLVDQGEGETIWGGVLGSVTSTTDTKAGGTRSARNVLNLKNSTYKCNKVHSDVAIHYDDIDQWTPVFKDFQSRYRAWVQKAIALDRLKIGWHGTHYAANSNMATYPMLQDCNKGWLQVLRDQMPGNVIDEIVAASGAIKIGEGGDYLNLDMAVHDLLQLIPEHLRADLVVLVGSDLLAADKAKLYAAQGSTPTEKQQIELQAVNKTYGGLTAYSPTFFPGRGIMITSLKNLVITVQRGTWRRRAEDKSDVEAVIDWNSRREGYGINVLEAAAYMESDNVKLKNAAGQWY